LQLVRGWFLIIEVSDQCDSNRFFVHSAGFAVGAALLSDPSRGHFDLPVAFPKSSVIYQEMIPEAIPEAACTVRDVYRSGIAFSRGGVVYDDVLPLRVSIEVYNVTYHPCVRDDEFLSYQQMIAGCQPVCRINGLRSNVIHSGDTPDRFHRPDLMINGPGAAQISHALFNYLGRLDGPGRGWRICGRGRSLIGRGYNCLFTA